MTQPTDMPRQCQYVVMFGKMGGTGLEWSAIEAHYDSLDAAKTAALRYAHWQILEVSAQVILSSQDKK